MANVNRALGPGWNVWAEHTDALQARDTGWLQLYVATVQEAYDATSWHSESQRPEVSCRS